jgi:hypothetical protein
MTTTRKRILAAVIAVAAALGLAGAAVAAGPPGTAPRLGQQAAQGYQGYGVTAGGVVMNAAADYLGISETALAAARHDGKSLAQIAVENGKSVAGLKQALVDAFETNLDQAVAAGRLTETQAAQALATFQSRVDALVNRTATGPLSGRGGHAGMGLGLGPGACGGRR